MDSKLRARRQQAFTLSAIAIAVTAGVGAMLGPMVLVLALLALPVPLFLLWFSADVLRYDERQEQPASKPARVLGTQANVAA